jgi:methionyl-tRNA formyltransferase
MNPSPTAFTVISGENVKVFRAEIFPENFPEARAGEIIYADTENGLVVAAKNGAVRLSELQFPNGKRMKDVDYLRGHRIK